MQTPLAHGLGEQSSMSVSQVGPVYPRGQAHRKPLILSWKKAISEFQSFLSPSIYLSFAPPPPFLPICTQTHMACSSIVAGDAGTLINLRFTVVTKVASCTHA